MRRPEIRRPGTGPARLPRPQPQSGFGALVQPFAHFLARLEERHDFCSTGTCSPVRGLRPERRTVLHRKGSKPRSSTRSPCHRGNDLFDLDADGLHQIAEVRILKEDADRADQRRLLRDDLIGSECCRCSRPGRETFDDDDDPSGHLQPRDRIVELLGTGGGAAR